MEKLYKAISFTVYGSNPKYLVGLFKNIQLASILYPGWKIFIYYNSSIGNENINKLNSNIELKLINMDNSLIPPTLWRFLVNDEPDIELFIVRDTDSRITLREVIAVYDWIKSRKRIHIMRDHPHHNFKILAGMWGMRNEKSFNINKSINSYLKTKIDLTERMLDQDYLADIIYKKYYFSKYVHATFHKKELLTHSFPIEIYNYNFVGEIFDENDNRAEQYKLLMND